MPSLWMTFAWWFGLVLVLIQAFFGWKEAFEPEWVFKRIFREFYCKNKDSPVWEKTAQLTCNMGLYNWFLAAGMLLSLFEYLGREQGSEFFALCVAIAGIVGLRTVGYSIAFVAQLGIGALTLGLFLLKF